MHSILIREMRPSDREAVIDLIWALNRFEDGLVHNRRIERDAAVECFELNQSRIAEQGGAQHVAVVDERVVGYSCAVIDSAPPYVRPEDRRYVWLADLVVSEDHRKRGIGTSLIQAAEAFARSAGARHMMIGSVAGNRNADQLYASLGYETYVIERLKRLD